MEQVVYGFQQRDFKSGKSGNLLSERSDLLRISFVTFGISQAKCGRLMRRVSVPLQLL